MTGNAPPEIDLLRRVASAALWAIASNGDDPVGRDGRARVGPNWVAANGALNKALQELADHYGIADRHAAEREATAAHVAQMKTLRRRAAG